MKGKIKRWFRNIIIRLLSFSGVVSLYRARLRREGPLVRVLAFHDVANSTWFYGVVEMLASEFNLLTPEEFESRTFHPDKINVLLTFDDGYRSWTDNVLPALEMHDAKGLFFVISGLLDTSGGKEGTETFMRARLMRTPKEPLSWEGASHLIARGHAIGGHTITHLDLTTLSADAKRKEIAGDKERIESRLGITLTQFAYPFGRREHYNSAVIDVVRESGYTRAYTAESGFVSVKDNPFLIPRTCIENNLPPQIVAAWVRGGYDIVQCLKWT